LKIIFAQIPAILRQTQVHRVLHFWPSSSKKVLIKWVLTLPMFLDQSVMIELANGSKKLIEPKVQLQEERLQINSDDEEATNDAVDQTETVQVTNTEEATRVPEHIIEVLKERNARIQEIITWVEGPCEQCFDSFGQICKSVDEVQRLENRHSELTTEFRVSLNFFQDLSFFRKPKRKQVNYLTV
jgi:hypothetical protein